MSVPMAMPVRREPFGAKIVRLVKENPLIAIGLTSTGVCMVGALYTFKRHMHYECQLFQRGRVMSQGFTVGAICLSFYKTEQAKEADREQRRLADLARFESMGRPS